MSAVTVSSLKASQLKAVHRMLAFNKDETTTNSWKILIYDAPCRSIISPLLNVSQLRSKGVTLHLLLESTAEREPIPDVPAIYFCQPTGQNVRRIAQDCAKGLYGRAHINFVTKLDRVLMEELAKQVVQTSSLDKIASVHDQYLDYVCLERNLFTLQRKDSYISYNSSATTDAQMEANMTEIAYGLFSVVATLGQVPVIRCPKGGAPEMVARKLSAMIAQQPMAGSHNRPLLVIMDRNADLITPIQHTSTYQALIDDVLQHNANRVEFTVEPGENVKKKKSQTKRFDLDADEDPFYCSHKFQPFPEAIESNGAELQEVTDKENQIRSKATTPGGGGKPVADPMASNATELATAVDSLPPLLERKKQLEIHTSILQAVMNQVAARDIPQFYELESSLATGGYKKDLARAKKEVLAMVSDVSKGKVVDKVRLLLVYCLATTAPASDVDEVANAMKESLERRDVATEQGSQHGGLSKEDRADLNTAIMALEYLKRLRSLHMISSQNYEASSSLSSPQTPNSGDGDLLTSFMSLATNQASGLLAKAAEKMLGTIHKHHATRVVESLCDFKGAEDEDYLYLDPKVKGDVNVAALRGMHRAPIRDVLCFMVGGGSYAEYQNLQMMLANDRRTITYGSTELVNPQQFLSQLGQLA